MKKTLIPIFLLLFVILGGTYFVGEMTQKELYKQVKQSKTQLIQIELLSYQKSFFTANAEMKLSIPVKGQLPLKILVNSDITHYPYKAKAITHFSLVDIKRDKQLVTFFQTKDWLTSQEEVNLFGNVSGQVQLVAGMFESESERLNILPLEVLYQYNLSEKKGTLEVDWAGFSGEIHDQVFDVNTVSVNASFTKVNDSDLIDYQYKAEIEEFKFIQSPQHLSMKAIELAGKNQAGKDKLTVNTDNTWKVKEFQNGQQLFMNNHIKLSLSELNLAALSKLKASIANPRLLLQELTRLASLGGHINLQTLQSDTPWGRVDGQLIMDIQRGLAATEISNNPLSLIDYSNGELSLSLPQALLQQPDVGNFVKMGIQSGVLKKQQQQLTLQASLDRGELMINGQVIPM